MTENLNFFESRKANADEKEGDFKFVAKEKPTEAELKLLGEGVTAEVCAKYSYYSLESYSYTRFDSEIKEKGKLLTFTYRSNENYPIFMRDCGTFKKVYKPSLAKPFRIFYKGDRPSHFINGLYEINEEYVKRKKKLPEIIICSGERQALCCAAMGYFPVWFNSELENFSKTDKKILLKYAYKVKYHENY